MRSVSLSNADALSQIISSCSEHDVVVVIRSGGSSEAFDIFNDEKVLKAFMTLLDYLTDHSAITTSEAGIHLKGQFDELFSRNEILEEQKIKIFKLENDLKVKNEDVIAFPANLKQLSDRTDIQTLMNENKSLVKLNNELNQRVSSERRDDESNHKGSVVMFIVAVVAVIAEAVLGKLM